MKSYLLAGFILSVCMIVHAQNNRAVGCPVSLRPPESPRPLLRYTFDNDDLTTGAIKDDGGKRNGALSKPQTAELVEDRTAFFKALYLKGDGSFIAAPSLGAFDAITVSTYINFDSFAQPDITLFESGKDTGSIRLGIHDSPGDESGKQHYTYFTFNVAGNTGGEINNGSGMRSVFQRLADREASMAERGGEHNKGHKTREHYWINVAAAYDSRTRTVAFYINGKLDSVKTFATAQKAALKEGRVGAGFAEGQACNGRFDEFSIYDRALSRDEARMAFNFERDLWAIRDIDSWATPSKTIYVDSAKGDDSNDGAAPERALRTVKQGLSRIGGEGTRLVIGPGVYKESGLMLGKSGSRFKPIVIEGAGVGKTVFCGSETWEGGWTKVGENRFTHAWPFNWPADGAPADRPEILRRREVLVINNEVMRPVATLDKLLDKTFNGDVAAEKSFMIDQAKSLIYLQYPGDPNRAKVEVPVSGEFLRFYGDFLVVRGLSFINGNHPYYHAAMSINGNHLLVEDIDVERVGGDALAFGYKDLVIRRCRGIDAGNNGLNTGFRSSNYLVEDCEVVRGGWRATWSYYWTPDPSAGGKNMFCSNLTFRRYNITDSHTRGQWWDAGNWTMTLENGYNARNPTGMWNESNPQGCEIRDSEFVDNRDEQFNISHSEATIFENNIVAGKKYALHSWEPASNLNRPDPDGLGFSKDQSNTKAPPLRSANTRFVGNLVCLTDKDKGWALVAWPGEPWVMGTLISADNRFWAPQGKEAKLFYLGNDKLDWTGWQALLPKDATSVWLDKNPFEDNGNATVSFKCAEGAATRSRVPIAIPVVRSLPVDNSASVEFAVKDGTAKAGVDYIVKTSSPLQFQAKQRMRAISIELPPQADGAKEPKCFTITLSPPSNLKTGVNGTIKVIIKAGERYRDQK